MYPLVIVTKLDNGTTIIAVIYTMLIDVFA